MYGVILGKFGEKNYFMPKMRRFDGASSVEMKTIIVSNTGTAYPSLQNGFADASCMGQLLVFHLSSDNIQPSASPGHGRSVPLL
jgi:hypothetical protein